MFERPILLYSNYCAYSQQFIEMLLENKEIFETFIRVNIDINTDTKRRPDLFYEIQNTLNYKIKEVPTIIIANGEYVLSGSEAFKWLHHELEQINSNSQNLIKGDEMLEGFNSVEMGSFSDMYSTFGSNSLNDAREQSFKFLDKPDISIQTPPEDSKNSQQKQNPNSKINFTNPNFAKQNQGLSKSQFGHSQSFSGKKSDKQKDFDIKLQQLLSERETLNPNKPKFNY
jgi:hypothetical protein